MEELTKIKYDELFFCMDGKTLSEQAGILYDLYKRKFEDLPGLENFTEQELKDMDENTRNRLRDRIIEFVSIGADEKAQIKCRLMLERSGREPTDKEIQDKFEEKMMFWHKITHESIEELIELIKYGNYQCGKSYKGVDNIKYQIYEKVSLFLGGLCGGYLLFKLMSLIS